MESISVDPTPTLHAVQWEGMSWVDSKVVNTSVAGCSLVAEALTALMKGVLLLTSAEAQPRHLALKDKKVSVKRQNFKFFGDKSTALKKDSYQYDF